MKRFKRTKLLIAILAIGLVGGVASTLVSCDDSEVDNTTETYTLTWEYDSSAVSITLDEYSELPTSFTSGETLRFEVVANTGYEIESVRANGSRLPQSNGEYYTTITSDTTISIESSETVTGLTIVSKPTKLTYLDGESIDVAGMVVEASYGTGRTETLEYGQYSVSPSIFSGGDTSFRVTYEGVSATVELDAVVEYVVNIDLAGGTLSESYISYLNGLEGLNNYAYDSTAGTIYFTYYNSLPEDGIILPTTEGDEAELTRENSTFNGWSGISGNIITNTSGSLTISASWQYALIIPTSASLIEEEGIPYLVVNGTYGVSDVTIYLFLYEGNDGVYLYDTDTGQSGNAGEAFELKFDLRQLSNQGDDFNSKWMDIKFAAYIDDRFETMDINVDTIEFDKDQTVRYSDENGGYTYSFQTYTDEGITTLKVMFSDYYFTYTIDGVETTDGVDYLKISGEFAEAYYGYTINVTWWVNSEIGPYSATSSTTDGTFELSINLDDFTENTNCYAHVELLDTEGNSVYGGTDTNMLVADCTNTFPTLETSVGQITNAISFTTDSHTYYVGYAWEGLMLYKPSAISAYDMQLKQENGAIYLGYQFEYGTADPATAAPWLRVQEINNNWTSIYFGKYGVDATNMTLETSNGIATYWIPISTYSSLLDVVTTSGTSFTVHYAVSEPDGDNGWSNFDNFTTGTSITLNGYQYELSTNVDGVDWLSTCLRVTQVS